MTGTHASAAVLAFFLAITCAAATGSMDGAARSLVAKNGSSPPKTITITIRPRNRLYGDPASAMIVCERPPGSELAGIFNTVAGSSTSRAVADALRNIGAPQSAFKAQRSGKVATKRFTFAQAGDLSVAAEVVIKNGGGSGILEADVTPRIAVWNGAGAGSQADIDRVRRVFDDALLRALSKQYRCRDQRSETS